MKKILALFLAFSLLFLTACNTTPPANSGSSGDPNQSENTQNPPPSIAINSGGYFLNLPSRVIFQMGIAYGTVRNIYYSKADGKAYTYCFDPLCRHENDECLASVFWDSFGMTGSAVFINNRFYISQFSTGTIISFNFDGTDKRIEYDAGFEFGELPAGAWSPNIRSCGPYIYYEQRATTSEDGKAHNLRFNVETKEMEDLTEKTGVYVWPYYFYNGEMYAMTETRDPVKVSLDFTACEATDQFKYFRHFSGSTFVYTANPTVGIYDMATGEDKQITYEELGFSEYGINTIGMDENYIYFLDAKFVHAGYKLHPKTGKKLSVTKNDGKIYRMNHDGTDVVCIFDDSEFDFEYLEAIVFDGNSIIIRAGKYRPVEGDTEGLVESYASGYYVGKFDENGMIGELELIEFVG